jgi:CheY-specific phosphatase CheX
MTRLIADQIRDITYETFEITCYMFPLDEWELEDLDIKEVDDPVKGGAMVRFDGASQGALLIRPNAELLTAIASNMLGEDEASDEQKEGALCEIANIICGNTVPIFAKDDKICYIRPPFIMEAGYNPGMEFEGYQHESLRVFLDEGVAEIDIYYSTG